MYSYSPYRSFFRSFPKHHLDTSDSWVIFGVVSNSGKPHVGRGRTSNFESCLPQTNARTQILQLKTFIIVLPSGKRSDNDLKGIHTKEGKTKKKFFLRRRDVTKSKVDIPSVHLLRHPHAQIRKPKVILRNSG